MMGDAMRSLVLSVAPDIVVTLAQSAESGLAKAALTQDLCVVILDFNLPGLSGAAAVRAFAQRYPKSKVVVVSGSEDRHTSQAAIKAGASAFISKTSNKEALRTLIRRAINGDLADGESIVPIGKVRPLADHATDLTDRQREVLTLLIQGHSNKEIALRMGLAEVTVKLHLSGLFRALNVVNRTQAVSVARHMGYDGSNAPALGIED